MWLLNLLVHSYLYIAISIAAKDSSFDLNTALKSFLLCNPICIPFHMPLPTRAPVGLTQQTNMKFGLGVIWMNRVDGMPRVLSGTLDQIY